MLCRCATILDMHDLCGGKKEVFKSCVRTEKGLFPKIGKKFKEKRLALRQLYVSLYIPHAGHHRHFIGFYGGDRLYPSH